MFNICPIIIIAKYKEINNVEHTAKYFKINRKKLSIFLNNYNQINKIKSKFKLFLKNNVKYIKPLGKDLSFCKYLKNCQICNKESIITYKAVNIICNNNSSILCKSCCNKNKFNSGHFKKGHKSWTLGLFGKNHPSWDGGKTKECDKLMSRKEYKQFKKQVLLRDNYTCVICSSTKNLEVDHIKEKVNYPHLIFEVSNGRTLCHTCHIKTDNYGIKARKRKS